MGLYGLSPLLSNGQTEAAAAAAGHAQDRSNSPLTNSVEEKLPRASDGGGLRGRREMSSLQRYQEAEIARKEKELRFRIQESYGNKIREEIKVLQGG